MCLESRDKEFLEQCVFLSKSKWECQPNMKVNVYLTYIIECGRHHILYKFSCLILSILNGYAIAQPTWRIGIAPNGMALVAVGSFFIIINCSRAVWFDPRDSPKMELRTLLSSSPMCRRRNHLGLQIKWAFLIFYFLNCVYHLFLHLPFPPLSWHAGL